MGTSGSCGSSSGSRSCTSSSCSRWTPPRCAPCSRAGIEGDSRVMTERQTPRRQGAKAQDIDRRAFVKLGVAGGAASLAAACGWDGGRLLQPGLLDISRVNDWVGEKVLFSPTHLARTYSPAERSAMLPSYFISGVTPMLRDPDRWRLRVQGLVQQPVDLSLDDLMRLPRTSYTVKHHCVEGWSAI